MLLEGLNSQEAYCVFLDVLRELVGSHVPECDRSRKSAWLSRPPRSLLRAKSSAWARYKAIRRSLGRTHLQAEQALEEFYRISREYKHYTRNKQIEKEKYLVSKLSDAPKAFHRYIRSKKKGAPSVGPLRAGDGSVVSDPRGMSEVLVEAFSSVFDSGVPSCPLQVQTATASMDELDITYDKVVMLLRSLNESSSPGPDGVHPVLLRRCASSVAVPLTIIFKTSLSTGVLPREWKVSEVSALFKKGKKADPLNYRPVSLTSVCCKVMERLLHGHMMDYLECGGLLSDKQFGFRSGRSTEDQLLLAYSDVIGRVDVGGAVDMVYLDFSKAFDLVSHSVLLTKLRRLGFEGGVVRWVESFISGREMWVSVGGCRSARVGVTSGVPQGSVLGPLLFLIYINSLGDNLKSSWYAFADDFKLYVSAGAGGVDGVLQEDLNQVYVVSESWNLKLNPEKCVVMRFGGCG